MMIIVSKSFNKWCKNAIKLIALTFGGYLKSLAPEKLSLVALGSYMKMFRAKFLPEAGKGESCM